MHPSMHSPYPCLLSISPQRLIKSWINDDYMNKVTVPALGLDDWSLLGMLAVHINILNFSLNFSLAWGKVFSLSGHFLPNLRKILVAGILGRESSWKRVYYILRNPSRFRKPPNSPLRLRHAHMCHDNSESKDSLGTPRHKYSRYIYIYYEWELVSDTLKTCMFSLKQPNSTPQSDRRLRKHVPQRNPALLLEARRPYHQPDGRAMIQQQ